MDIPGNVGVCFRPDSLSNSLFGLRKGIRWHRHQTCDLCVTLQSKLDLHLIPAHILDSSISLGTKSLTIKHLRRPGLQLGNLLFVLEDVVISTVQRTDLELCKQAARWKPMCKCSNARHLIVCWIAGNITSWTYVNDQHSELSLFGIIEGFMQDVPAQTRMTPCELPCGLTWTNFLSKHITVKNHGRGK